MEDEIATFEENDAWNLVEAPKEGSTIVLCEWVYKCKFDSENNVRYRASPIEKRFTEKASGDYFIFSPIVRFSTSRLLIAISVKLDLDMSNLDLTTALLKGVLSLFGRPTLRGPSSIS